MNAEGEKERPASPRALVLTSGWLEWSSAVAKEDIRGSLVLLSLMLIGFPHDLSKAR